MLNNALFCTYIHVIAYIFSMFHASKKRLEINAIHEIVINIEHTYIDRGCDWMRPGSLSYPLQTD